MGSLACSVRPLPRTLACGHERLHHTGHTSLAGQFDPLGANSAREEAVRRVTPSRHILLCRFGAGAYGARSPGIDAGRTTLAPAYAQSALLRRYWRGCGRGAWSKCADGCCLHFSAQRFSADPLGARAGDASPRRLHGRTRPRWKTALAATRTTAQDLCRHVGSAGRAHARGGGPTISRSSCFGRGDGCAAPATTRQCHCQHLNDMVSTSIPRRETRTSGYAYLGSAPQ